MYDIDRALRRLELAHRLEELEHSRPTPVPGPAPVPEISAPLDVVSLASADEARAERSGPAAGPAEPRTLPNGLPVRTPGTRFHTSPKLDTGGIVIPLGQPLPPVGASPATGSPRPSVADLHPPAASWAADHDAAPGPARPDPLPPVGVPPHEDGVAPTRPGVLPVSELLAGMLTSPPTDVVPRRTRGAFTPDPSLARPASTARHGFGRPEEPTPGLATAGSAGTDASGHDTLGHDTLGHDLADPAAQAPSDASHEAQAPAREHADSAAERIAAMLRGGHPGLLA